MKKKLDEGVLEEVDGIRGIYWDTSTIDGKHLPYVRIERHDGSSVNVRAAEPLSELPEAIAAAKALAEKMIAAAQS